MWRLRMDLAYDGTAYHGWQRQRDGSAVQNRVEEALARLLPACAETFAMEAASRTDAGVHALGQVIHIDLPPDALRMPLAHLPLSLNALLPEDIRVLRAARAGSSFHARFSTTGKEYRYHLWNHPAMNPLRRGRAWHVPVPLDREAMSTAAALLTGRHDFKAFTTRRDGVLGDSVRTLSKCAIRGRGADLAIDLHGSGFLYRMCRAIAGTLVQVGLGKIRPDRITGILEGRDRCSAGANAPACGLVLMKVRYGPGGRLVSG